MLSSYTKLSPTQPKVFIPKCSFSLFTNLIYLAASHCLPNKELGSAYLERLSHLVSVFKTMSMPSL